MSIKYMTAIWSNSKQTGTRLLILLAIADHANDEGIAWPGMKSLAHKARLKSRISVLRAIQSICADGELEIITHGGKGKTNKYKIDSSLLATSSSTATIDSSSTATILVAPQLHKSSVNINKSSEEKSSNTASQFKTRDIQKAYEECVPYKVDWVRGEGHAAKWIAEAGYTPNDVKDCYVTLKLQPFWKDKPLSLASIKKQIGEWKTNGMKSAERVLEFTA